MAPGPELTAFAMSFKVSVPWPGSGNREDLRQWRGDCHPRAYHEPRQKLCSRHTPDLPAAAGTLGAQAGGGVEAAGRRQGQSRSYQPRESSRRMAARAGGSRPTPTSSKAEAMPCRVRPEAGAAAVHESRQEKPNTPPTSVVAPAASSTDPARRSGPPSARDGSGTFARLRRQPPKRPRPAPPLRV